ncbi:hypothetical protein IM660_15975 [Ruania alkalisoli]|uniref:Uncharacterized protein n=1 Tax=Ruania alkalisoli TaxID=2779775 RepID=A0A7M1SR90_9MICO|nr:hypothetical protein [Ruania alkalisoli]QOR70109.1 hypothetical protein IM660_15975 [Ruania alkalisoli]
MKEREEFELGDSLDAPHTDSPRRRPQTWSGPWPWAMVAVVLLVTAVVISPQGERPIPTAEVAWVVDVAPGTHPTVWAVDDHIVTVEADAVVARSAADGERQWHVPLQDPVCSSDGVRLACVSTAGPDGEVTLIAADGSTQTRHVPGAQVATPLGSDVILVGGDMEAPWAARLDQSGATVWRSNLELRFVDTDRTSFGYLHATQQRVLWRLKSRDNYWPAVEAIDPSDGSMLRITSPLSSFTEPEENEDLVVLESDERSSETAQFALRSDGVAEHAAGPLLWRWDDGETPLAIDAAALYTAMRNESLHPANGEPPQLDGTLEPVNVRLRDLTSGAILAEAESPYPDLTCPCTAAASGVVARALTTTDGRTLSEGEAHFDLAFVSRETATPAWRYPLEAEFRNSPARLASHGDTVVVWVGGEVVALTAP